MSFSVVSGHCYAVSWHHSTFIWQFASTLGYFEVFSSCSILDFSKTKFGHLHGSKFSHIKNKNFSSGGKIAIWALAFDLNSVRGTDPYTFERSLFQDYISDDRKFALYLISRLSTKIGEPLCVPACPRSGVPLSFQLFHQKFYINLSKHPINKGIKCHESKNSKSSRICKASKGMQERVVNLCTESIAFETIPNEGFQTGDQNSGWCRKKGL